MKKLYLSDKARKTAIENIWDEIDIIMTLNQVSLTYGVARDIVANLNKLADVIYDEVEDKSTIKRYKYE